LHARHTRNLYEKNGVRRLDENAVAAVVLLSMMNDNKRRAVAAQTARSRCKVPSVQYVYAYYLRAYRRQKTLNGVGVTSKLHFAIFAAFKESMTLNFVQKSFKVIHFATSRKCVYIFVLTVNSYTWTLFCTCIVSEIWRLKCRKIFPTPFLFRLKFRGVPFGVDPSRWGLQRAKWLG